MESCRNVLFEFVYREANAQIQSLGGGIRHKYNLEEVIAYALNRLPAMFVSTDVDLRIKRQECIAMQADITKITRQAMMAVRKDPLREPQPLESIELANAPNALLNAQELLGSKNLMWSDLPEILKMTLENALAKFNAGNLSPLLQKYSGVGQQRINPNMYLSRSNPSYKNYLVSEAKKQEYEIYMIESLNIVHSLERLVIKMAQHRAQNFNPSELKFIRLEDVLAKTLNQLPPLYVTSHKGLNYLRHYAQMNIGSEVASIVYESMIEVRNNVYKKIDPLIFYKIRHEREQALIKVSQLLFNREVKWQNLNEVLSESLDMAKTGQVCWDRSPVKPKPNKDFAGL